MKPVITPRVLVIRGGAIGDFILTLPAIRVLRDSVTPQCHLELIGYPGIVDLALIGGLADATRSLEHRAMALLFARGGVIDEALCEYLCSFNLIVSYLYDPDGHFRDNMQRIGVKCLIECSHRIEAGKGHATEQLARPLEKLAFFLDDPVPRLAFHAPCDENAEPLIAIHPGSGSLKKNWPLPHWIRLGRELQSALPHIRLALITGEAEQDRGITREIVAGWAGLRFTHFDSLPLTELACRLPSCAAFLGHDSGISHLAAAVGLPCHVFFGPTDPGTWVPRGMAEIMAHRIASGDLADLSWDDAWPMARDFVARKIPAHVSCAPSPSC